MSEIVEQETQEQTQQVSQDTKDVMEKILNRNSNAEPEKPKSDKEQVKEETQENEVQLTQEAVEEFKELGYEIEDLENFTSDELKGILKTQLKKEKKEVKQQEPSIPVIPEELATKGFLKNLGGKPITELISAFEKQGSYISQLESQINELKKTPDKTKFEIETIEEQIDELDLVELDPKEQRKAIKDLVDVAVKDALKQYDAEISQKIQPVQNIAEQQALENFYSDIQTHLPTGMKASEVFNDWLKDNDLTKEEKAILAQSPNLLIKEVARYAKAIDDQKKEKEKLKKSKITVADQVRKKLKEADNNSVPGSTFNATTRDNQVYVDQQTDETVRKILARQ